jgi:hypothetical protein
VQHLVGAERKNYDRDKPKQYCARASPQAAGMRTRSCKLSFDSPSQCRRQHLGKLVVALGDSAVHGGLEDGIANLFAGLVGGRLVGGPWILPFCAAGAQRRDSWPLARPEVRSLR